MDIAEKTLQLKQDFDDVYEAGKQEKSRETWERFQNGGNGASYFYAFSYNRFNDETYNPIYPIRCSNGVQNSRYMFYSNELITDTKVPIYIGTSDLQNAFYKATNLETIRLLSINEETTMPNSFLECSSLKNITFEGVIGASVQFNWSHYLTTKSIVNIIEHLSATASGMSLTISGTAKKNMTFPYTSEESGITYNSWDELIATKTNWTISIP